MLVGCGIPVDTVTPSVDERSIEAALSARDAPIHSVAGELAKAKAINVSARVPGRWVLGADQTLTCEGLAYHKPADRAAARAQVLSLSGHEHVLTSAFCLARDGVSVCEDSSVARMQMRVFDEAFVDRYLLSAGDRIFTSVGGYQLETFGSHLFSSVDGDHFTILGLPLFKVLSALRQLGALAE